MSFFSRSTAAKAICLAAGLTDAHLIIKNPIPFGVSTLNNSPLNNAKPGTSESDYPCKQRPGVYDITSMNYMKVGEPQLLDFTGSASHGGGTCQLAVSLDEKPTANSTFKLIQVFEGGCPIDSDGNGLTHPFTFSIPEGFPNGVSTFAWAWFNRIGNREIYMNCAPITVTGGSDDLTYYNSLPNMYVINLPTSECESGYGSNAVTIPNPGQFIMREMAGQSPTAATGPSCSASAAAMTQGVVGYKDTAITTNVAAYSAPATNMDSTGTANPQATPASQLNAGSGNNGATTTASSSSTATARTGPASPASNSTSTVADSQPASSDVSSSTTSTSHSGISGPPTQETGVASFSAIGSSPAVTPASSATSASTGSTQAVASTPSAPASDTQPASSAQPVSITPATSTSAAAVTTTSATTSAAVGNGTITTTASSIRSSSMLANNSSAPASSSTTASSVAPAPTTTPGQSTTCDSSSSALQCNSDGSQFALCANSVLVWQDVAPGTKCVGGQITRKRDVPFRRSGGRYFRA